MIFQLFRIRKTYRDIKEAKNDPRGFAEEQLKETALGAILAPLVPMFVVVVLCFVFGYMVGDGSGFFRVVFWIFFIPFTIFSASMWALYRGMKKLSKTMTRKTQEDTIHVVARDSAQS